MIYGEQLLTYLLEPIQPMRNDPDITEIVINRPGEVGTEAGGRWSWYDVDWDYKRLDAIALLTGSMTSRQSDPAHPLCKSTFPNGERVRICRPPATKPGIIAMSIRKPPKTARNLDDDDVPDLFAEANMPVTRKAAANHRLLELYHAKNWTPFFTEAVRMRKTIGSTGITGSGKSDWLRRLSGAVPEEDRFITIENDAEFGDVGPRNKVSLFYNDDRKGQTALDVVSAALSMYPKTLAFQEVTGPEAFALCRAILSGHNSFTSWHAEEGDEIGAMAMMLRQHPACHALDEVTLHKLVKRCFDIIVSFYKENGAFHVSKVWFKEAENENN